MMTKTEIINYYVNLLIMQYKGKPKAEAHIRLVVGMILMDMLPFAVNDAFDLNNSSGYQLDVIGKYQNVKRTGYTFTKQVTLGDAAFRSLIKLAIIKNSSGSSLYEIDELINAYFGDSIRVYDFGSMRMGYMVDSSIGSTDLIEMMIVQGLLPKPMAVSLSSTVWFFDLDNFFGYSTYTGGVNPKNSPYNTYADYNMNRPWVTYKMIIGKPQVISSFITTEIVAERLNQENNGHLIA